MKTIHLIRHAKSSWDFPNLNDQQRPLNKRGNKDSQIMAMALHASDIQFGQVYCSVAQRARQTIQTIAEHWPAQSIDWQVCDALYTFSSSAIASFISTLDDHHIEVFLVGHNPALTDFINQVSDADLDNLPTCGYVELVFAVNNWQQITSSTAKLTKFLKPKMFK